MADLNERVVLDPKIQHGKPIIRGTRVPIACLIGGLAGGMTFEEVAEEYGVTVEDIRAALSFACRLIAQEEHHPLPV